MTPSLLAILARFDGDTLEASTYCRNIAREYPALADEYWAYVEAIEAHVFRGRYLEMHAR